MSREISRLTAMGGMQTWARFPKREKMEPQALQVGTCSEVALIVKRELHAHEQHTCALGA